MIKACGLRSNRDETKMDYLAPRGEPHGWPHTGELLHEPADWARS